MINYPEYAEINGKKYKINTDFRYAIECDKISRDETIGDLERALAVIFVLFGEDGINAQDDYESLLRMAKKYLLCNKELEDTNEEPDMDYSEDMDYIEASFQSDYGINLENTEMHWWKFNKLINGLSNSELGNCCILNKVRNLRNYDVSEIKDQKERDKIIKAKERVALKRKRKEPELTEEQKRSVDEFYKSLGF